MCSRTVSFITAVFVVVIVASCGSDPATTSPTSSDARRPASSTSTSTTSSTTTSTATTTTTLVLPTDPPAATAGWTDVAIESLPSKAFPPCCADTWHGDVSPALAPEGQPLADGQYAVDLQWPQDLTQPLELNLFRFEQCALLPEFSCESRSDPYLADELGIDTSTSRSLDMVLDDAVDVVVVGWNDSAVFDDPDFVIKKATGTDLAALATEVDEAYGDVFADRFAAGESPDAIIADVLANPTSGFSPSARGGGFVFTPESGPPLLVQSPLPYIDGQRTAGRGTDVLSIRSIEVIDGQVTLYVFSGYYP
jgi:hypothetical protein